MSARKRIDLSLLEAPEIINVPSFDTIYQSLLDDLKQRLPDFSATLPSDPAVKILESASYCCQRMLHEVNQAGLQVMLAFARGPNLDHLGALVGVKRLLVEENRQGNQLPTEDAFETDTRFRTRIQQAPEGLTTAGSKESYIFHAMEADADVLDVSVISPSPGIVAVTVLSKSNDGIPSEALLAAVHQRLSSDDIRPLTDNVMVDKATVIDFDIVVNAVIKPGPDPRVVIEQAKAQLQSYLDSHFTLGASIALSRLYGAFANDNIERVTIESPNKDLILSPHQAPRCLAIDIDFQVST